MTQPQPQQIDWQRTPYLSAVVALAFVFSLLGLFAVMLGVFAPVIFGAVFLIAAAVVLGVGVTGWMIYAAALFWRYESRNQMLAICAALVRDEQQPDSGAQGAAERGAWWNRPEYRR